MLRLFKVKFFPIVASDTADAAEPSEVGVSEYVMRELQAGQSAHVAFDVLHKIIR